MHVWAFATFGGLERKAVSANVIEDLAAHRSR
jgi:hypothetical protein